mmetsp:Transcript_124256/g.362755  ORF Transcript_124256/g.362755 Transcript_124256/m.362755 type:complete len:527 (-) Transcript_124256:16-1596(-)
MLHSSCAASSALPQPPSGSGEVTALTKLEHRLIVTSWREAFAPYFAEFCGTFLIALTYLCNSSAGDHVWAVTSNALMMTVAMYVFGHVSGGNLNPCISLALYLARRHTFWTACCFCFFQIAGGSAAAFLFHCFHRAEVNLGPKPGFSWWEASIVECLFTSMIVFVFLNCAASRGNNPVTSPNGFIGMAVGLCHVAGGYASMDVSGTVMNPAVAIGLQIMDSSDSSHASWGLEYLPMEILGALLAVSAYRLVRPKELDASLMFEPHDPLWQAQTSSRVMAEFIGTFYIVFTKALNNIGKSKAEAWSVAAAVGCMQYALRGVSGGHFNPAVSVSAAISSRRLCTARNAILYIGAQIFAGLTASAMYGMVHHGGEIVIRPGKAYHHSTSAVIVGELIFTCLSCYTVLATSAQQPASSKLRSNDIAGLAIGMCSAVGGFAVGNISGSVLNPAMALGFTGLNVIGGDLWQSTVGLYVLYEILGGLLASGIFVLTHVSLLTEPEDEGAAAGSLGASAPLSTPLPVAKRGARG